ncbi:MAG TPA: cytochrome P450 [Solirubrobacteraceae bacterium]|jgi:cytochrome P450|nr:cytochrome P450 [Solirubrobacteraceae bacterium]
MSTTPVATDIETFDFWRRPAGEREAGFRWLRENDPVSWHPPVESLLIAPELNTEGFWAVTKAAHIQEISRNTEVFSSAPGIFMEDMPEVIVAAALSFLAMDAPEHPQLRGIVHKAFSPGRIRKMEGWIREHAHKLVAEIKPLGGGDMCPLLTKELPGRIYAQYIGADCEQMRRDVIRLADRLVSWNDPEYTREMEPLEVLADAADGLSDIALALADERRTKPGEDMLTWLVQAEFDGRAMEDWEIASFFVMLSGGANDTTAHLTGSSLVSLDRHPDQKAWLLEDFEGRIDAAIDELLRFNPPLTHFRRTATQDYELAGETIKAGEQVVLWYISGSKDEELFEDPDRLVLARRNARQHVTFGGGGPHYCLGSALGRQLLKCALREVYSQLPDFAIGEVEPVFSNFINGVRRVNATWSA